MNELFAGKTIFNDDISKWDVSNVTCMTCMFSDCFKFDCDLSKWNVSKVTDMTYMFNDNHEFHDDISYWNVSSVKSMERMFFGCRKFDCDLSPWNFKLRSDVNMTGIFEDCSIANEHKCKKLSVIDRERFDFVIWLYHIRKQNGRKYGFLQPDFICIIFGPLMPGKTARTDSDIKEAVEAWAGKSWKRPGRDEIIAAEEKYGHISKWDTSRVTTMSSLFLATSDFNDDISKWDVKTTWKK